MKNEVSMLHLLTLFSLFFLFFSCTAKQEDLKSDKPIEEPTYCDCNQLVHDPSYNNFYLNKPKKGYTGMCELFFFDGSVQIRKEFKDGKVHGEMKTFYESGQLRSIKYFDMNLQTGNHFIYSEDNRLLFFAKYERGQELERIVSQPMPAF